MAKTSKPKKETKKRGEYEDKLTVKGSFSDIMKAAVKHREKNIPANKKP
jgi:hypothetical protein